jgi:nucleoside-diphosphate-sugar epimerase
MNLSKSLTLVTGSTGFIGSNFLNSPDAPFLGNVQKWNKQIMGTLLEGKNRKLQLDLLKPRNVIHLAWASTSDPNYDQKSENFQWGQATVAFAQECFDRNIRFITIGSAIEEYTTEPKVRTPYADAKNMIRRELISGPIVENVSYLKPSYIFSIKDQRPRLMKDFLSNGEKPIDYVRNPGMYEEFIHIDDLTLGLHTVLHAEVRGFIDLGGGIRASVSDFINTVSLNLGGKPIYPWRDSEFEPIQPNLILQNLGWNPSATTIFFQAKSRICGVD